MMDIISAANIYLKQLGEQRPSISDIAPSIFLEGGPEPSALVEISGRSKSGKSLLLMQLIAECVPRCHVILLNMKNKIDPQIIAKFIKVAVKNSNPTASTAVLEDEFDKCLNSLEIINCFSSAQLEIALKALDNHILLDDERISLLAVDGLGEGYWLDLEPGVTMRKYIYYMNWLGQLKRLCNRFYISCMYTVDSSFNKNQNSSSRSIVIDHKLCLEYSASGERTLNDKPIVIDENGINIYIE